MPFYLAGELWRRMVVIVWTPRGAARRIISMRKPMSGNKTTGTNWVDPDDAPELTDAFLSAPMNTRASASSNVADPKLKQYASGSHSSGA